VSGGAAPAVPLDGYLKAIVTLKSILDRIKGEIYVTLGNEIFTHPRVVDIITVTREIMPDYYSYHGLNGFVPTTGMALVNRKDRDKILEALQSACCAGFMLTLHGDKDNHNRITRNEQAFDAVKTAVDWVIGCGFDIKFNLMLNKSLIADWREVRAFVRDYPQAVRKLTVPLYLPTARLRNFQQYRAEYSDCLRLKGALEEIGIDENSFFRDVFDNCETSVYALLKNNGFDYAGQEAGLPDWAFFNITQSFDVFYGNAGLHTKRLGNLLDDDSDNLLRKIAALPSNYEWSAYYDVPALPPVKDVLCDISPVDANFVYSSIHDCVYSWLDRIGVPSILIK